MDVPMGTTANNSYVIEYDEDLWESLPESSKDTCKGVWRKKAESLGVRWVGLRLVPDPMFPRGAREKPYIAWQHMFPEARPVKVNPCPFCRGESKVTLTIAGGGQWREVECTKCGAVGPHAATEAEAVTKWNSRP